VTIGAHWDVSWHRSIGRDTFWTPAHTAIYLCGVLAGISCGYLILRSTFAPTEEMAANCVRVFGLRGPLGAFLAAWGGVAMITSAPFDNWWHNAYGLDVKIVSPPHTLLMVGIFAVEVGALLLIIAEMNRARSAGPDAWRPLQRLMLYLFGLMMVLTMFFRMEYTWDVKLHNAGPYRNDGYGGADDGAEGEPGFRSEGERCDGGDGYEGGQRAAAQLGELSLWLPHSWPVPHFRADEARGLGGNRHFRCQCSRCSLIGRSGRRRGSAMVLGSDEAVHGLRRIERDDGGLAGGFDIWAEERIGAGDSRYVHVGEGGLQATVHRIDFCPSTLAGPG
jgi:hypothetical protein